MTVEVVVTLESAAGKGEEVLAILQSGRTFALSQDGCEGFDVYQGKDEPNRFLLIEHWSSVEKHQPHFQKNVLEAGVLDSLSALTTGDISWGYYESR